MVRPGGASLERLADSWAGYAFDVPGSSGV
jgi:hypothetical protein